MEILGNWTYIFFADLTAGLGARTYLRYLCIICIQNFRVRPIAHRNPRHSRDISDDL
jgi:hypothetical protein